MKSQQKEWGRERSKRKEKLRIQETELSLKVAEEEVKKQVEAISKK